MKKYLLTLFIGLALAGTAQAQFIIQRPSAGGTGIGSATIGDIGSCLKVLTASPFVYELGTCGTGGGGSGGGTFSTTTSQTSGVLINYPNNSTDVVVIGSNASTTGEVYFDPNTERYKIGTADTASTTIRGILNLPTLSQGGLYIGTLGRVFSGATTTAGTGLTYSGNAFNVNTSQNISTLSNLTTNGFVKTSGGTGALSIDTNSYLTGSGAGVTAVSVASANGFTGSSSGGATPALTLTTSITGLLKGNGTAISAGANGTDYTLITGTTCSGSDKVSAITASGAITCSADQSGSGGSSAYEISTSTNIAVSQLAYITQTSGRTNLGSVATTTFTPNSDFSTTGTIGNFVGGANSTLALNMATPHSWTGLQSFLYSSSTIYSSFLTASSTFYLGAGLTTCNSASSALTWSGGVFGCNSITGGTGLTSYDAWTHPIAGQSATTSRILITNTATSTVTGKWEIGSSTMSMLNGFLAITGQENATVQANLQNKSSGSSASSDWVATADNGSDTTHYVNMGINGSGGGSTPFTTANHAYLYSIDDPLNIGALGASSFLTFNVLGGTSPIERARIANTGNFLIGSTTDTVIANLLVASTTAPQLSLSSGAGFAQWTLRNAGGDLFFSTTTVAGTATTSTSALTLRSNAGVGLQIGTTSSAVLMSMLDINLGSTTKGIFIGAMGSSTPSLQIESANNGGTVLMGTTTNALNKNAILATGGKVYMSGLTSSASNQTYYVCLDANFQLIADTTTCLVSALKFKKDIKPLDIGLTELLKVEPVTYYYKDTRFGKGQQIGVIADQVDKIDTRLTNRDSNGDIHGFNYEQYTAWITKGIQDFYKEFQKLVARVSGLEKRVNEQQKQIDDLQAQINQLKK